MANEFYDNTGFPMANSPGSSQAMRNELTAIEAGFDKLPTLTGNGGRLVAVNILGTALEAVITTGTGNAVRAIDPTFTLTDTTTNNASAAAHGWLPKLSGNVTDYFRGNGTWSNLPVPAVIDRAANTILTGINNGNLINCTAGFTQTLTAAATLGNGWSALVKNSTATADVTIDPNGAETIDGASTLILRPGDARLIVDDGTNFRSVAFSGNPGRVLLASIAPTSSATVADFPTVFSSRFDDYEIFLDNVNGGLSFSLRFQFYQGGSVVSAAQYGTTTNQALDTTLTATSLQLSAVLGDSNNGVTGVVQVMNVNSTWAKGVISNVITRTSSTTFQGATYWGTCSVVNAMTGFRLSWGGVGQFNPNGTIRVYGIRKDI